MAVHEGRPNYSAIKGGIIWDNTLGFLESRTGKAGPAGDPRERAPAAQYSSLVVPNLEFGSEEPSGKRNQVVTKVCLNVVRMAGHDPGVKTSFALFRRLFGAFYWPGCRRPLGFYFPWTVRPAGWMLITSLACAGMLMVEQAQAGSALASPAVGPTGVIVQSQFGGQIFGFDIDQASNEGILCEAQTLDNGRIHAAVETFNQTTGAIIKVIRETQTRDDFVTLGVVGNSIGLVEREHSTGGLNVVRTFITLNPLRRNRFTGEWTPPVGSDHLVTQVSRTQGTPNVAVYALDLSSHFRPTLFTSDVGANTFGPVVSIADQDFVNGGDPPMAYDSAMNRAVLGHATLGNPFIPGKIATVDLTTGAFMKFTGVGLGDVNGIAVDPETGTVCTTTEIDFSVEFYDLATHSGSAQPLPGAFNQIFSGADVQFDSVNKLFLVAQPVSSTAGSGSSIHVYDVTGNLVESINGLSFSNASNVVPAHIALNPRKRIGFVDGPDPGVTQIQSFTY